MNYYKINFSLMKEHSFGLSDIENMIPFEREIYISLLNAFIAEKNKENQT